MTIADALLARADAWIDGYWNAGHLRRTLDWVLVLDAHASDALRLAALTHDMERHFPGGPQFDPGTMPPAEDTYRQQHSERSAQIVGDWLAEQDTDPALVSDVRELIVAHEVGGDGDADLLQAADSISFLETNVELIRGWFDQGRCTRERAKQQHERMFKRIRVDRGRELALPYYEAAIARMDEG